MTLLAGPGRFGLPVVVRRIGRHRARPCPSTTTRCCGAASYWLRWHARGGNHPFAALLAGPGGEVLLEQGNGFAVARDGTAHAERLLATAASRGFGTELLRRCTLVSSAEPCAMCAGAIYWAGIGRMVYGLSERRLRTLVGQHPENLTLDLPCRTVFAAGQRPVQVIGPLLEDEALTVHADFWSHPPAASPGAG